MPAATSVQIAVAITVTVGGVETSANTNFGFTGTGARAVVQTIGTIAEVISNPDNVVGTFWVLVKNLSSTVTVDIVKDPLGDAISTLKLGPGESSVFQWLDDGQIGAVASSSTADIQVIMAGV